MQIIIIATKILLKLVNCDVYKNIEQCQCVVLKNADRLFKPLVRFTGNEKVL